MSETERFHIVKCCESIVSIRDKAEMGINNVKLLGMRPKFSQDG